VNKKVSKVFVNDLFDYSISPGIPPNPLAGDAGEFIEHILVRVLVLGVRPEKVREVRCKFLILVVKPQLRGPGVVSPALEDFFPDYFAHSFEHPALHVFFFFPKI
jgi:hypothetical protein